MRREILLLAALALGPAPAAAEGTFGVSKPNGTWGTGGAKPPAAWKPSPGYGAPVASPSSANGGASTARIYSPPSAPKAEPFKPYQPYKPNSVFGPDSRKKP
ncbi:hypothetical protein [Phenylobacterium kunshanense]|uniref:Uncharacterized protein n=1 Tax=Phenylobacterium kunshanense TaxID=1445034 RepID=A0A328BV74_9CAUL|nr:hypothetical protein [Phenylobacterium kunshanense]RAK68958.1 hypothetical protein DJ019_02800 [Phenylobacterium kunshanense]